MRRIGFGCLSLVIALLPVIAWWLTLRAIIAAEAPIASPSAVRTPNPSKPAAEFLGPIEMLVYTNPFFAGTIPWWLLFWLPVLGCYVICAAAVVRFRSAGVAPRVFRPGVLFLGSLLLGTAFVAPWLYTLCRLATRA